MMELPGTDFVSFRGSPEVAAFANGGREGTPFRTIGQTCSSPLPADPLYSHRCSLPDRSLWFGKATLYEDRVCIQGWTWRGRYRQTIAVEDIDEVEWRPRPKGSNLILHLEDGQTVPFRLRKGAGLWNAKLHDLLDQSVLDSHGLPANGRSEEGKDQEAT